jgi:plastocyanin
MYAPTSDATASSTVSGFISIAAAVASSTTASTTTYNIDVTTTSSSDYTLNGSDRNGSISGSDPDLTFAIGDTINFNVDTTGHPFYLKTVQGTGTSDTVTGATNNGSENATVSWTPTTGGTYFYQCSIHAGMVGTITIQ